MRITNFVNLIVGSPQFRIKGSVSQDAPVYKLYSQVDLAEDLTGVKMQGQENKQVRTLDKVTTLDKGDIVFSLISGSASIITESHTGYLFTQNYVLLRKKKDISADFLVYLLNEDRTIKRQLQIGLQGSMVLKYTVRQLRELIMPPLPSTDRQQLIGNVYLKQLRLQALQHRYADNEVLLRLAKIEEIKIHG
ncbi:restriction endonuclease subunit M [Lentilactobacillus hilgardii]|uniref:restriction endonuclease subunit M n=1 Tax=Lentilactobacillus hilgardii TaxID=1588 RepID=UPI0039EC1ACF